MSYRVKIREAEMLNHNVRRFRTEKPPGFEFEPGQATELALPNEADLADEKRPFTFTSLPADPDLEFTIKIYPGHDGVTDRLAAYGEGDVFEIGDAWGAITYQGPGIFLAGGAGITPFLSILRDLDDSGDIDRCGLWFSNQTAADIFLERELTDRLGDKLQLFLTDGESGTATSGRIDRDRLKSDLTSFDQKFYICGPEDMVTDLTHALETLGVDEDHIITEDLG